MSKQKLILLGGNLLNKGVVDKSHQKGFSVIVVDWNENPAIIGDLHIKLDVKDYDAISVELDRLNIENVVCIYTSIDLAVSSVNFLNRKYNLFCTDELSIKKALSKELMTKSWKIAGFLNRFSGSFEVFDRDLFQGLSQMDKLIVKPNLGSSSRGITIIEKNSSVEEFKKAFDKAKENSFDEKVIIEEFVEGREYTVEMLGDNYGNVLVYAISLKYHTQNTIKNKIAVKLHYNSNKIEDELYAKIAEFGRKCYSSLGLKNSFGHLELIVKKDGSLTPVEIGARSSGYVASHLVELASGRDFLGDYISVLKGGALEDGYLKPKNSSMYFFYDIPAGIKVQKTTNLMEYLDEKIMSIDNSRSKLTKNASFDNINNDNERVGFEILGGDKKILTIEEVQRAEKEFINNLKGLEKTILRS